MGSALQEKADTDPNYPDPDYPEQKFLHQRSIFDGDASNSDLISRWWKILMGYFIKKGWFAGNWGDETALQPTAAPDADYPEQISWRKRYIFDGDGSNLI